MLEISLRAIRNTYPVVDDATVEWLRAQTGPVRMAMVAASANEAREVLDRVWATARLIAGTHGPAQEVDQ